MLAVLLAFMMVFTLIPGTALAEGENGDSTSVIVSFTSQGAGEFLHDPQINVSVSSDLAENYGYTDKVSNGVSALDVLVKAHEIVFEKDFCDENTNRDAYLSVSSTGWVTKAFGESSGFGFAVNGVAPTSGKPSSSGGYEGIMINETKVMEKDYIDFFFYQDATGYTDNYCGFLYDGKYVNEVSVLPNQELKLNVKSYNYAWYGAYGLTFEEVIENENVTIKGNVKNANVICGDEVIGTIADDGKATLSFNSSGRYYLTLQSKEDTNPQPIVCPLLTVNVGYESKIDNANVTIVKDDTDAGHRTIAQDLEINWCDLNNYLADGSSYWNGTADILLAHALIEGVYYNIYGQDAKAEDLANPTIIANVKENLSIRYDGNYFSTKRVLDDATLVMSNINDVMSNGLGDSISNRDKIVFYPWNDKKYGYIEVLKAETSVGNYTDTDNGTVVYYPVIKLKLRVKSSGYDSNWSIVTNPIERAAVYKLDDSYGYKYGVTNASGTCEVEFMESAKSGANSFIIKITGDSINPIYQKVSYNWNADADNKISDLNLADIAKKDTSLTTFQLAGCDVKNYCANNLTFDLVTEDESAVLNIVPADSDANVKEGKVIINSNVASFENNQVTLNLSEGINQIIFTVINGEDEETYSLTVNKSASQSDLSADIERVINGILNGNGYTDSTYSSDWILSKNSLGKAITETEKNAFLKQVLVNKDSWGVGSKAKAVIALSALGIDATKVPDTNSDAITDLVASVYNNASDSLSIYDIPYVLRMYDLGIYEIPSNAKWTREKVVESIISQHEGWNGWNCGNGVDGSAMMLEALATDYKAGKDNIVTLVDNELKSLKQLQGFDGTFANNSNATEMMISALSALGKDAEEFSKDNETKNAIRGLFVFETDDNRFGYTSKTYNEFSTVQGLQALASYKEYKAGKDGSIYKFDGDVAPYTNWPEAKLATAIIAIPSKTLYEINGTVDKGNDITVKVVYNSDDKDTKTLSRNDYKVTYDFSSAGTKQITVTYNGLTTNYNVFVSNGSSQIPAEQKTVSCIIRGLPSGTVSDSKYVIAEGETVLQVTQAVLNKNGISVTIKNGNYIAAMGGLGEFDKGPNSGWMYSVNGYTPPTTAASDYILNGGESIVWYYTKDYTKEPGVMVPEDQSSVTTSGTSGSATTTTPTEVTVSGDTAKATIKTENATEAIKQAKEKKSAEIVIEVANADIKTAEKVQVEIPTATAKEILNATTADLTVKTPIGTVTVPQDALKEAVAEAKGTTITIEVAAVSKPTDIQKKAAGTNGQIISVTIKSGSTVISTFGGKSLKLKSEVPAKLKGKNIVAIHIAADGTIEQLAGKLIKEGTKEFYEFITAHLSTFAIVDADEIGLEAKDEEANVERIKKLVSDMSLKARSSKTSKKNIKVTLTVNKDTAAAIKEIKDMGYTVKYKYYRSTRKASKYQAKITKTTKSYTNTAGKKGTKYYYKARVQVYDKDGKLVAQTALKQCRYAVRTWSK